MEFKDFPFGRDDTGRRLDKIIRRFLPDTSLSQVYSLIRKGLVKINGKKTKENYKILEKDVLNIAAFLLQPSENPSEKQKSESEKTCLIDIEKLIVFKNEHLLILNKPYDITVHGDSDSLDVAVKDWYGQNIQNESLSFRPGPLHRLDRKTTGLLAFSLSTEGARWFTENIENHVIRKSYLGIMEGEFKKTEKWTDKLSKNEDSKGFVTVIKDEKNGKTALSTAIPVKQGEFSRKKITLCQFDIETGRHHQIRSQCSIHGYPLLGDSAYGSKVEKAGKRSFYLHAWKLKFPSDNPLGLPEELICPLDEDFLFV